jgi:hypothetical protein
MDSARSASAHHATQILHSSHKVIMILSDIHPGIYCRDPQCTVIMISDRYHLVLL